MMPRQIVPRRIESLNPSLSVINPSGSYKQYAQIFGARKRKSPGRNALSKFYSGYIPGLQRVTEEKEESRMKINESINNLIRNGVSRHVNKYMKSPDGKQLRQEVTQLIRMKLGKKKI